MSEQGVSRDQVMTLVVEARIRLCEDRFSPLRRPIVVLPRSGGNMDRADGFAARPTKVRQAPRGLDRGFRVWRDKQDAKPVASTPGRRSVADVLYSFRKDVTHRTCHRRNGAPGGIRTHCLRSPYLNTSTKCHWYVQYFCFIYCLFLHYSLYTCCYDAFWK